MERIVVPPRSWVAQRLDALLMPCMYILSGTFSETPMLTHRWNNVRLSAESIGHLDRRQMTLHAGIRGERPRSRLLFHLPILGGWRNYIVLAPQEHVSWHLGWITEDVIGVSQILLGGSVRALLGPGAVLFFGIQPDGAQLNVVDIGRGRIGEGGEYARLPLV